MSLPSHTVDIVNDELVVSWDGKSQSLPKPRSSYILGYRVRGDWFIIELPDIDNTDTFSEVIYGS